MQTAQRRRFRRMTIVQAATLLSQNTGSIMGEIRDFSPNGVLFNLGRKINAASLQNQLVTIEFKPNLAVTEQYRIVGRVVRFFDLSMGIAVEHFPPNAYRDLIQLTNQPKPKTASVTPQTYSKAQTNEALAQCHAQFKAFITQTIAHFYNSLGAKLAYSAEQAVSLEERWVLHNAYPLVAAQRNRIERAYLEDDYLHRDIQEAETEETDDEPTLSLVDTDEFDDWLAVSQLVNRLNLEYSYDVGKFESRYEILMGTTLKPNANPFGPNYIFQTFRELLSETDFKNQIKSLLYKAFYDSLIKSISEFYAALNETLKFVQLPQAPATTTASTSKPANQTPNASSVSTPYEKSPETGHSSAVSLSDYLKSAVRLMGVPPLMQQGALSAAPYQVPSSPGMQYQPANAGLDYALGNLLENLHLNNPGLQLDFNSLTEGLRALPPVYLPAGKRYDSVIPAMHNVFDAAHIGLRPVKEMSSALTQATTAGIPVENLNQILEVVNGMQKQRVLHGYDEENISIKQKILDNLPQFESPSLQDRFYHSLQLFDEMLSLPLSDDALNSDIRNLLKKIELTLLKLALLDENFLRSSDHPAQQTVNLIERFYVAADDAGKLFDPQLQKFLNLLANQIVDKFDINLGVFDEVNQVLRNLLIPIEEARKDKVVQLQLACNQRETLEAGNIDAADESAADMEQEATSGINLLRQGNWLAVMIDGMLVPYQLVWLSPLGKLFVLTSRSATVVREFSRISLVQDMVSGQVVRLSEYDIPFMERSAHKIMLNAYEQVYQHATHDPVSGLLNRKGMMIRLDALFAGDGKKRQGDILCMLMFDQLSLVYHNCEPLEAEASLVELIGVIVSEVSPRDVFARLGENTFAILLHDSSLATAQSTMQTMVSTIEHQRIHCQGKHFAVGVNVGIAEISDELESVSKLLRNVGSACVAAKALGINAVQVYEANSEQIRQEQSLFEWAGAIDQVFHDNHLFLRCQKIQPIDTGNGELPHYEILLGIDKSLTTNPQEFVLAAEKWNRSADIDLWVLQNSFEWLRAQGDKLESISGIAINLSGHSLSNKKILAYIHHELQTRQVPADKLIFEITETAVISKLDTAQRFIETIRAFGCRFSLDDFGSGYSSFAYLKNFKVDYLKIDGAFIRDLAKSPADFAMVKSMHQIGHALGLKTVAEYVENQTILGMLSDIGVDYAQGYGIEVSRSLDTLVL